MDEYIKKESVLDLQTDLYFNGIKQLKYWRCSHIDPIAVKLLPAVDVKPVVYGKWEYWRSLLGYDYSRCSVCQKNILGFIKYSYCPNCDADMRGTNDG